MYKSLVSFNLNLPKLNKSLKKVCLCTIVNIVLIIFIVITTFYLIRRLNSNMDNIETFKKGIGRRRYKRRTSCNQKCNLNTGPIVKSLNKLNNKDLVKSLNKLDNGSLVSSLNKLVVKLHSIDSKLDYVTGFKNVTSTGETINYPDGDGVKSKQTEEDTETEEERKKKETQEVLNETSKQQKEENKKNIIKIANFCANKDEVTLEELMKKLYLDPKSSSDKQKIIKLINSVDISKVCPGYSNDEE